MSAYVLIHGAWHGGWCWKRVAKILRAAGHEVFAPSLTGSGERKHLLSPSVGMDTYVADIVNLIEYEELDDVVLVGHSAAGAAVSKAAETVHDRLKALVYLDSVVLPSGKSMFDVFPEQWIDQMRGAAEKDGGNNAAPPEKPMMYGFFASDCTDEDKAWVLRMATAQPLKPYEDKVDLDKFYGLDISKTYINCKQSQGGLPGKVAEKLGLRYVEMDSGHDPMVSQPEELAEILLAV
jgi:pimeloyl-ACP methyl ester carboxylesterase